MRAKCKGKGQGKNRLNGSLFSEGSEFSDHEEELTAEETSIQHTFDKFKAFQRPRLDTLSSTPISDQSGHSPSNLFNKLKDFGDSLGRQTYSRVHQIYVDYLNQTDDVKNATKTGYTYAKSLSYNPFADRSSPYDWVVPNMSRAGINSKRLSVRENEQALLEDDTLSSSSESSVNVSTNLSSKTSVERIRKETTMNSYHNHTSNASTVFTRSQCSGGKKCSADCELHKTKRKKKPRSGDSNSVTTEESMVEERRNDFEFSDDDLVSEPITPIIPPPLPLARRMARTQINSFRLSENSQRNLRAEDDDESDEEITIVRKITRICQRTVHSSSSAVKSFTPEPIQRLTSTIFSAIPTWILYSLLVTAVAILFYNAGGPQVVGSLVSTAISGLASLKSSASSFFIRPSKPGISVDFGGRLDSSAACGKAIEQAVENMNTEMQALRDELDRIKTEAGEVKVSTNVDRDKSNEKYEELRTQYAALNEELNNVKSNCCSNQSAITGLISQQIGSFWSQIFPGLSASQNEVEFAQQVKDALLALMLQTAHKVNIDVKQSTGELNKRYEENIKFVLTRLDQIVTERAAEVEHRNEAAGVTIDEVKQLIRTSLEIYDADKTGLPDFALEPAGGSVVNIRCSETFDPTGIQYRILGIPVWSSANSPRTVIQPTISPGECWAFKGFQGHLVIRLSEKIRPTSFTYEHIPRQISRDGKIASAPSKFQVRGLDHEDDKLGDVLGNYEYADNGHPLQNFVIQDPNPKSYQFIELVVQSNHGHPEYTCLYRFRVHGKRVY
ncbi:SUN domain-containing protein 1 [Halotydeus destructor]|nr:SUN domain-containing protein 1 [Halotydeus destructor]